MIVQDPYFHRLDETNEFILGNVFEDAYLISKKEDKETCMGSFYGDPDCGLIDSNNNWCLVSGNLLNVWTKDKGLLEIEDEELSWICQVRQKSEYEVEILIDPWSEKGSVWTFNVKTLKKQKVREYKLYGEHSDHIDW